MSAAHTYSYKDDTVLYAQPNWTREVYFFLRKVCLFLFLWDTVGKYFAHNTIEDRTNGTGICTRASYEWFLFFDLISYDILFSYYTMVYHLLCFIRLRFQYTYFSSEWNISLQRYAYSSHMYSTTYSCWSIVFNRKKNYIRKFGIHLVRVVLKIIRQVTQLILFENWALLLDSKPINRR